MHYTMEQFGDERQVDAAGRYDGFFNFVPKQSIVSSFHKLQLQTALKRKLETRRRHIRLYAAFCLIRVPLLGKQRHPRWGICHKLVFLRLQQKSLR